MGSVTFVDTSAVVAILHEEEDAAALMALLARADRRLTSASVRLESAMALSRLADIPPSRAQQFFNDFLSRAEVEEIAIDEPTGRLAVSCFERYGKGRHPARLNFGDCLSYACAKTAGARLLFKGDDFSQTDVNDGV